MRTTRWTDSWRHGGSRSGRRGALGALGLAVGGLLAQGCLVEGSAGGDAAGPADGGVLADGDAL
ncbi:MAG: hypothetical protein OEY14_18885, partial [Myxococcales bacterium]|nr:hypothetical protein [Myxococcales bacterium]